MRVHPSVGCNGRARARPPAPLVPSVGGTVPLEAATADEVVGQLEPRIVIPMHFKTSKLSMKLPLAGVEPFLEGKKDVRRTERNSVVLGPGEPGKTPAVVVLSVR